MRSRCRPWSRRPSPLAIPLGGGTSTPVGLNPSQIEQAYGFNTIAFSGQVQGDGSGQTIAIVNAYADSAIVASGSAGFGTSDLARFDQQFGLPNPSLTIATPDGAVPLAPGPKNSAILWAQETALDVEWRTR